MLAKYGKKLIGNFPLINTKNIGYDS